MMQHLIHARESNLLDKPVDVLGLLALYDGSSDDEAPLVHIPAKHPQNINSRHKNKENDKNTAEQAVAAVMNERHLNEVKAHETRIIDSESACNDDPANHATKHIIVKQHIMRRPGPAERLTKQIANNKREPRMNEAERELIAVLSERHPVRSTKHKHTSLSGFSSSVSDQAVKSNVEARPESASESVSNSVRAQTCRAIDAEISELEDRLAQMKLKRISIDRTVYYVLDTSSLLSNWHWIQDFDRYNDTVAVIPIVCLQELDGLKRGEGKTAHDARVALRGLERLITAPPQWLRFQKAEETVCLDRLSTPIEQIHDDQIIACARYFSELTKGTRTTLVSEDKAMLVKAAALGLRTSSIYKLKTSVFGPDFFN